MKRSFRLPWPPSCNGYWRAFRGRQILSKRAREYRVDVVAALSELTTSYPSQRLQVTMEVYPPTKRRTDLDNLTKGLLDALTHAGVWGDDSQIDDLRIVRREVTKPGWVDVHIEEL